MAKISTYNFYTSQKFILLSSHVSLSPPSNVYPTAKRSLTITNGCGAAHSTFGGRILLMSGGAGDSALSGWPTNHQTCVLERNGKNKGEEDEKGTRKFKKMQRGGEKHLKNKRKRPHIEEL
ncbi:unnamed protein product [Meloidogyne enterolobii]|uniref:Uncharacterized protein n=1 Tax=Meloidogyne enterolobii TaxID=390850 RepID=A0ACB0YQX2_MELEN